MEHRIDYLLNKLSTDAATESDWNELLEAIRNDHSGKVIAGIEQFRDRKAYVQEFDPETPEWNEVFQKALTADRTEQAKDYNPGRIRRMRIFRLATVAAVLVIATLAVLFLMLQETKQNTAPEKQMAMIQPGSEGAVLTLANGKQIVIDTATSGLIAAQNGSDILITDGAMSYRPQEGQEGLVEYNTMTTPTGKQFQFTLPDGTKVWLNAASSIKYPTSFRGNKRTVAITGEAYFDVAQNQHQPFIVSAGNNARIEVLGTSFNVNAYPNEENLRTTLISGLVKVTALSRNLPANETGEALLRPGQQAIVSLADSDVQDITINREVNTDKVIAWKKGLFNFEGSSLVEVMKELERWYNIEVVYEGTPPVMTFYGKIGKQLPLNDLLEVLDKSRVKFIIEGRKLIVKQ